MFLEKDDYTAYINDADLEIIQKSDDEVRTKVENTVISQIKEYLSCRYNVAELFSKTGTERNDTLIMYMCDMAIYHLLSGTPGRFVSEQREKRYNDAIKWLEKINVGTINPDFPYKDAADSGSPIKCNPGTKNQYIW